MAGGAHPSPVGYAEVITTTTHKTLRGPRGAMILCDEAHTAAIDKAVFPGLQGGPHNHTTAAIAVCLHEASQPVFAKYAEQVVTNAQALAEALNERGFDLVSGGTDNHLILIDLTSKDVLGKAAAKALDRAGLTANYNTVPYDTRKPFNPSGLRMGTPAVTSRGMGPAEMVQIADWMDLDAGRAGPRGRVHHRGHRGRGARGGPRLPGARRAGGLTAPPSMAQFDGYVEDYRDEVQSSISFSGQEVAFFHQRKADALVELTGRLLGDPARQRVLDVGCGVGSIDRFLAGRFAQLCGVDTAPDALARGHHENPEADLRGGRRRRAPLRRRPRSTWSSPCASCTT